MSEFLWTCYNVRPWSLSFEELLPPHHLEAATVTGELCFFLWCGVYTLGLYLRGCLRLGSPLKQMPTREVLFVRCLRGMPTQGAVTNFSHIR